VLHALVCCATVLAPAALLLLWSASDGRVVLYVATLAALAFAIGLAGLRRGRPTGWRVIATGVSMFTIAEAARVLEGHDRGIAAVASGLTTTVNVLRLASYVVLAIGVLVLVHRRGVRDRAGAIDASIVACALVTVLWPLLAYPTAWYGVALPLAAVGLCAVATRLAFLRGRAYRFLFVGLLIVAADDIVTSELTRRSGGRPACGEAVVLVALGLVAYAAHRATDPRPTRLDVGAADRMRILCVLALVAPSFIAPLTFAWLSGDHDTTTLVSGLVAMLMFDLVALRLWHLASEARSAARRDGLRRLGALVQGLNDAIFVVDRSGAISYASPRAGILLGSEPERLVHERFQDCLGPMDASGITRQLDAVAAMPTGSGEEIVGQYIDAEGNPCDFEINFVNRLADRDVMGIVITMRDVTARRHLTRELERRAFRDDLTKLANRALFMDRLDHASRRSGRSSSGVAVMLIDLDDFKAVNDGLGHAAGDALLRAVSERLAECMRAGDTIARLGGDEFAVLVEDAPNPDHVVQTAERLLEVLQLPVTIGDISVTVPASIGIAFAEPGVGQHNLVRDADIAL